MTLAVRCVNPACARTSTIPDHLAGRRFRCPGCGSTLPGAQVAAGVADRPGGASESSGLPARVGRFEIRARLGAGAFGTVYRAYDPQLDREVALKVPNPGVLDSPGRVERFLREARAAAGLRHPNIVPVHDAGRDGDRYYIASAFIDGRPLSEVIEDEGLPFERAARLARELAEALAYAHGEGVVHRDVKPANCMIDAQDRLHLMDFGLAVRGEQESRLTTDGSVMGTPAYMAPEQAAGKIDEVGPAADQYACGVVLYELLTGRTPFEGPAPIVIHNQIHAEPEPPSKLRPGVPRDLETIGLRAIAKPRGDRYLDCGELADDLRRWLDGEPIRARRMSIGERLGRWARRNKAVASLAVALLASMLLGILSSLSFAALATRQALQAGAAAARAEREAQRATSEMERANRQAERAEEQAGRANAEAARVRRTAYIADLRLAQDAWDDGRIGRMRELLTRHAPADGAEDLRGLEWHYLRRLPEQAVQVIGQSRNPTGVALSPDGALAVWCGEGRDLILYDAIERRTLATLSVEEPVLACEFDPLGASLWGLTQGGALVVWRDLGRSSHAETVASIPMPDHGEVGLGHDLAFSRDASKLAVSVYRGDVTVLDVESGEVQFRDDRLPLWHRRAAPSADSVLYITERTIEVRTLPTGLTVGLRRMDDGPSSTITAANGTIDEYSSICFLADDLHYAVGTVQGKLLIRSVDDRNPIRVIKAHNGPVVSMRTSRDGSRLLTASNDHTIRLWSTATWEGSPAYRGLDLDFFSFDADESLDSAISKAPDGTVARWTFPADYPHRRLQGFDSTIREVAFDRDGSIYGVTDHLLAIWKPSSDQPFQHIELSAGACGLAVRDARRPVWVATTNSVEQLDRDGRVLFRARREDREDQSRKGAISLHPDGERLVERNSEGFVIRSASDGAIIERRETPGVRVNHVRFTPDGQEILVGCQDGFRFWRPGQAQPRLHIPTHLACPTNLPPGGEWIAVGGWGGQFGVFDTRDGRRIADLKGNLEHIKACLVSEDGRRLVAISGDKSVYFWETESWQEVLILRNVHEGAMHSTHETGALHRGCEYLITSCEDLAYLWDCRP